jgi:hypothetical protein
MPDVPGVPDVPAPPDWAARAEPVDDVRIDVAFIVEPSFYYGPSSQISPEQWETLREPLYMPEIPGAAQGFVLSADCTGREDALCRHYRDLLAKAARHGKDPADGMHFWSRPVVHAPGRLLVEFPWHDRFSDARAFLESLAPGTPGEVFSDYEQGWYLDLRLHDGTLYLRNDDPDEGTIFHNLRFAYAPVRAQVDGVLARAEALIARLTDALGRDHWTHGQPD